jgi:hypothetical protein
MKRPSISSVKAEEGSEEEGVRGGTGRGHWWSGFGGIRLSEAVLRWILQNSVRT